MICLSSAGGPAWFQIHVEFRALSTCRQAALTPLSMSSHCEQCDCCIECDLDRSQVTCRAQSAFVLSKRRVSLTLRFGWWENKTLKQACWLDSQPAPVAFKNLMTHGSAIRIAYRTSLRSSSLWEPRYPSLRIWIYWLSLVRLLCLIRFIEQSNTRRHLSALKAWLRWIGLMLMILPQVHLRKPCYDFSFL